MQPPNPVPSMDRALVAKAMTTTTEIKPCLTKKEVAERLNISVRKLQYMIADGEIVGFYVGNEWRMKPENLERWIDNRTK